MSDSPSPPAADPAPAAPEGTRAALIEAALGLFAGRGYDASPTREIAARAGTNVASIAYHFGSKAGLRAACAAEVARRIGGALALAPEAGAGAFSATTPAAAAAQLEALLRRMVSLLVARPESAAIAGFMLREVTEDGPVLDSLYAGLIGPAHRRICALWAAATGTPAESEAVRLVIFSLLGQILYFRLGQPVVRRRMGWAAIGPEEAGRIADRLARNLHAIIADARAS